jgi:hypothetical protein
MKKNIDFAVCMLVAVALMAVVVRCFGSISPAFGATADPVYFAPPTTAPVAPPPSPAAAVLAPEEGAQNRVTVLGGFGPDGLSTKPAATGVAVSPYYGPVFGLEYERLVLGPWSASLVVLGGGSTQSRTFVGVAGVGYSW